MLHKMTKLALALSVSLSTMNAIAQDDSPEPIQGVMFAGQTFEPWYMYVGNPSGWMVNVRGDTTSTQNPRNVKVELLESEVGQRVASASFRGGATGQLVWQADESYDFAAIAHAGGALAVVLKVVEKPSQRVTVRMDCGWPCTGMLKFDHVLNALPEGEWVRIGIPLDCFENAGTVMSRVNAPLVMITNGRMKLDVGDVRLELGMPETSLISCQIDEELEFS